MCKNAYVKISERTGKECIFCHLKDGEEKEIQQWCHAIRFCKEKDKFVENNMKQNCKNFK